MSNWQTVDDNSLLKTGGKKTVGFPINAARCNNVINNNNGPNERRPRTGSKRAGSNLTASNKDSENSGKNQKTSGNKQRRLEKALWRWFNKYSHYNITRRILFIKARHLAQQFSIENFTPTDGWLARWKARNNILARFPGEKKSKKPPNTTVETVDLVSDTELDDNQASDHDDEACFEWNGEFPLVTAVLDEEEDTHRLVINAEGQLVMVEELQVDEDQEYAACEGGVDEQEQEYALCEDAVGEKAQNYASCVDLGSERQVGITVCEVFNGQRHDDVVGKVVNDKEEDSSTCDLVVKKLQEDTPCEVVEGGNPLLLLTSKESAVFDQLPASSIDNIEGKSLPTASEVQTALTVIRRTLDTLSASEDDFCLFESLKAKVEVLIAKKGLLV